MNVINSDQVDRSKWESFVKQNKNGTVFHAPYMYNVYSGVKGFKPFAFFAVSDHGIIEAMLAGFLQTVKPGLLSKISTRSVLLHGPIYENTTALESLLKHYNRWVKRKALYTEVRNHYLDDSYNSILTNCSFTWEGHYNIINHIPSNSDELWEGIGRQRRRGINKAKKFSFEIVQNNDEVNVKMLYLMLKENYRKLRLPIPPVEYFERCVSNDFSNNCKLFSLIDEGQTKIVLLSFLYKKTLHNVYMGSDQDPEFIKKRPVDYLFYYIMEWCILNNVKYFDWMGAGKPGVPYGVRDFKIQYGGELIDYGRFTAIHAPLRYRVVEMGFKMMQKVKK